MCLLAVGDKYLEDYEVLSTFTGLTSTIAGQNNPSYLSPMIPLSIYHNRMASSFDSVS